MKKTGLKLKNQYKSYLKCDKKIVILTLEKTSIKYYGIQNRKRHTR